MKYNIDFLRVNHIAKIINKRRIDYKDAYIISLVICLCGFDDDFINHRNKSSNKVSCKYDVINQFLVWDCTSKGYESWYVMNVVCSIILYLFETQSIIVKKFNLPLKFLRPNVANNTVFMKFISNFVEFTNCYPNQELFKIATRGEWNYYLYLEKINLSENKII